MIAVYDVLRRAAFFLGADGDGHSVLVRATDENHVFFLEPQIADVDVCRHVNAGEVSDVYRPVGIRQCRCDSGTFEFLFHVNILFLLFFY